MGSPMIYDQLKDKLQAKDVITLKDAAQWHNALEAIVDMHKPTDNYAGLVCEYCFDLSYEPSGLSMDYEDYVYPCPTIRIINEQLC